MVTRNEMLFMSCWDTKDGSLHCEGVTVQQFCDLIDLATEALAAREAKAGEVVVEAIIEESDMGDKFIFVELPDDFGDEADECCTAIVRPVKRGGE